MGIPIGASEDKDMHTLLGLYLGIYLLGLKPNTLTRAVRVSLWLNKVDLRLVANWEITHHGECRLPQEDSAQKDSDRFRGFGR